MSASDIDVLRYARAYVRTGSYAPELYYVKPSNKVNVFETVHMPPETTWLNGGYIVASYN